MRRSEIRRALVAGWLVWGNSSAVDQYLGLPPGEQRRYVSLVLELSGSKPDGRKMTEAQATAITNVCLHMEEEETRDIVFGFLNSADGLDMKPPQVEINRNFTPADNPMGPYIHGFLNFIAEDLRDPAIFMVLQVSDYLKMFQNTPEYQAIKGARRKRCTEFPGKAIAV